MRPEMRRSSRATSRAMRSACHALRNATSVPLAPCSGWARTWAWSASTRASASSSVSIRSGRRRSSVTAARWKLGLRGANGRGSSMFASRRIGPGKSSGDQRTIVRCWVSASTRFPERPRSCFSTTARPPRFGAITTSPGRNLSSRLAWAACAARRASSRPARRARYSSMSPLGCCDTSRARSSCARVRSSWRVERHRVAVGVELGERQVEQPAGLFAFVALHEVCGHVVGRAERRRERVRAPRREPGDLVEGDERIPQHDRVADLVDPAPPGAARELGVLARRQELVVLAGELRQLLDHDRAGGHVDAQRQGLGREHDPAAGRRRTPPRPPPSSAGPCPAWCAATPASRPASHAS